MTILYEPSRAAALAASLTSDNPIFLYSNLASGFAVPTGTLATGPAINLESTGTAKFCLPVVSAGACEIRFTVSSAITALAVNSHNIGRIGGTMRMQYDSGGGTWVDSGAGLSSPTDDQAVMWRIDSNAAPDWRLLIEDVAGVQPEIANIWAGAELVMPVRFFQGYAPPFRPNVIETTTNISDAGDFLGTSVRRSGSKPPDAPFEHVPDAFVRGDFAPFIDHHANGEPFFFAWRPTTYPDLYFAWRDGNPITPQNAGPGRRAFNVPMRYFHAP